MTPGRPVEPLGAGRRSGCSSGSEHDTDIMTDPTTTADRSRRRFLRTTGLVAGGLTLGTAAIGTAAADAPNFQAGFWGDGERWGTKALGELPEPNNEDSLDQLFFIPGQAPLSEAAPGNPAYNGGRWWAHTVEGVPSGAKPVTSYEALQQLSGLTIEEGGHDPIFFECPLLPYKD